MFPDESKDGKRSKLKRIKGGNAGANLKGKVCLARLRDEMPNEGGKTDPLAKITVKIDDKIIALTQMTELMEALLKHVDVATTAAGIPLVQQVLNTIIFNIKAFLLKARIRSADKLSDALYQILLIENFTVRRILLEEILVAHPRLMILGGSESVSLLDRLLRENRTESLKLLVMFNVLKLDARSRDPFDGTDSVVEMIAKYHRNNNRVQDGETLIVGLRALETTATRSQGARELLTALSIPDKEVRQKELAARFKLVKDPIFMGGSEFDVIHFILHNNEFEKMAVLFAEGGLTLDTAPNFSEISAQTVRQRIQAHAETYGGRFSEWIHELQKIEEQRAAQNAYHLAPTIPAILHSEASASSNQMTAGNDSEITAASAEEAIGLGRRQLFTASI